MAFLFPALGSAIALAGADKLFGNRAYAGMFRHFDWSRDAMNVVGATELAGGLLMAPLATRRIGGALVVGASLAVLSAELKHRDSALAAPRAAVLMAGLFALFAP